MKTFVWRIVTLSWSGSKNSGGEGYPERLCSLCLAMWIITIQECWPKHYNDHDQIKKVLD